jgi:signal transduction histidine kinase
MAQQDLAALHNDFFNQAEMHFMIFDQNLDVIDANESILKYYHIKKEDILGKNLCDLAPDIKEKGLYDKYRHVLETGEPVVIENSISHSIFGNQINRIKVFKVGNGVGSATSNITELRNTIEMLSVLSHRISHDVRSPLANILGLADIALDENTDPESMRNYCSMIKECAVSLTTTLKSISNTLRIHEEAFTYTVIDFEKEVHAVRESLQFIDGYNAISFSENIDPIHNFYFDQQLLHSVLQNLIDNGIKYRKLESHDCRIDIRITTGDNYAKIVITDNGIGIDKSFQKHIFKLFNRGTQQSTGTGVGLYLVRTGIMKTGGNISFESESGVGTTFTVIIPNKKMEADAT